MIDFNLVLGHRALLERQRSERDEFRFKHKPPGVRYWELYSLTDQHVRRWTTSMQGELFICPPGWVEAEVNHLECTTRMKAWARDNTPYEEDDEL